MSLTDVSRLTTIPSSALSAYASGAKTPNERTRRRIAEAEAVGPDSRLVTTRTVGFPQLARAYNDTAYTPVERLSMTSRAFQQAIELELTDSEFVAFHGAPGRIADAGWEALLHGAAEMSWRRRHPDEPLWWVTPSRLQGWWTPMPESPRRRQRVFREAPNALLARRVLVTRGTFMAV